MNQTQTLQVASSHKSLNVDSKPQYLNVETLTPRSQKTAKTGDKSAISEVNSNSMRTSVSPETQKSADNTAKVTEQDAKAVNMNLQPCESPAETQQKRRAGRKKSAVSRKALSSE